MMRITELAIILIICIYMVLGNLHTYGNSILSELYIAFPRVQEKSAP